MSSTFKKTHLLGENFSTASHKLRKAILFKLLTTYGHNRCFRCNEVIDSIDDLSIEHKIAWQTSTTPRELFYDLDNIAFSHLYCNRMAAAPIKTQPLLRAQTPSGTAWCAGCKEAKPMSEFWNDSTRWNGKQHRCIPCKRKMKQS